MPFGIVFPTNDVRSVPALAAEVETYDHWLVLTAPPWRRPRSLAREMTLVHLSNG